MGKPPGGSGGAGGGRRETRSRKVSQRMAVVDEATRQQAAQSRLDALENDNAGDGPDPFGLAAAGADEDDEFVMAGGGSGGGEGSDDDDDEPSAGRKRKRKGAKRKTRGMLAGGRAAKSFQRLLDESGIADAPDDAITWLSAAAGPSVAFAARKFCSVCGFVSPYTCARCGSRYCCRRCFTVHTETRCLKFMA